MELGTGRLAVHMQKDKGEKGSDEGLWVGKWVFRLCVGELGSFPGLLWEGCYLLSLRPEFGAHGRFVFASGELDRQCEANEPWCDIRSPRNSLVFLRWLGTSIFKVFVEDLEYFPNILVVTLYCKQAVCERARACVFRYIPRRDSVCACLLSEEEGREVTSYKGLGVGLC